MIAAVHSIQEGLNHRRKKDNIRDEFFISLERLDVQQWKNRYTKQHTV